MWMGEDAGMKRMFLLLATLLLATLLLLTTTAACGEGADASPGFRRHFTRRKQER